MPKTKSSNKFLDAKHVGPEPHFGEKPVSDLELTKAYSWYNYTYDKDASKEFTLQYLKANNRKEDARKLSTVKSMYFGTLGWICKMRSNGAKLPERTVSFAEKAIGSLIDLKSILPDDMEEKPEAAPIVSIQQRIADKSQDVIGDIEEELDNFTRNGYSSSFRLFDWLQKNEISTPIAKRINDYYKDLQSELNKAVNKSDKDIVEAYSNMKKSDLKKSLDFVSSLVSDSHQYYVGAKNTKKPRKKKKKSAEQLTSKLKYKMQDNEFKISSIDPKTIIQSKQLWVFNTKTRCLGVYNTDISSELNIKGTTITGFDEKSSVQKTVRKPNQVLPTITQGGKVALRTALDSINAKTKPLNGRINSDTVLLRVSK